MSQSPRPWQIGDVVNGHRWDGQRWTPAAATPPATGAPGLPRPGEVRNGYLWDGTRWLSAVSPPATWPPSAPPTRLATTGHLPIWLLAILAIVVCSVALAAITRGGSPVVVQSDHSGDTRTVNAGGDDAVVIAGAKAIARGCSQFAGANGYGPSVDDVQSDGAVARFVVPWPTNPYTGLPMASGHQPGDFSFFTATHMPDDSFTGYVYGHLANGEDYPVEFRY